MLHMIGEPQTRSRSSRIRLANQEDLNRCLDPSTLEQGQKGYLEYWQFHVLQVVDSKNVMIAMNNPKVPAIWIADYDTGHLVDGESVRVVGPVVVGETKTFPSQRGSSATVRVVRLTDKTTLDNVELSEIRTWKLADSSGTIDGRYIKQAKGKVTLQSNDGELHEIEMKSFTKADRNWLVDRRKAEDAEAKRQALRNARENQIADDACDTFQDRNPFPQPNDPDGVSSGPGDLLAVQLDEPYASCSALK